MKNNRKKHKRTNKRKDKMKLQKKDQNKNEDIEMLNAKWSIIVSIVSALVVILTFFVNFIIYIHKRAYFDFWKIPKEYISIDKKNNLYEFVMWILVIFIAFLFCNVCWFIIKMTWGKNKFGTFIICSAGILILSIGGFILCLWYNEYTWKDIWICIEKETTFVINLVSIFAGAIIGLFICFVKIFKEIQDIISKINTIGKSDIDKLLIIVIIFIFFVAGLSMIMYSNSKSIYANKKNLEIVTIDSKQYAVILKLEEEWIIKECKIVEGNVYVNLDEYIFKDIKSYTIRSYVNSINNKDCRLNYNEFLETEQ